MFAARNTLLTVAQTVVAPAFRAAGTTPVSNVKEGSCTLAITTLAGDYVTADFVIKYSAPTSVKIGTTDMTSLGSSDANSGGYFLFRYGYLDAAGGSRTITITAPGTDYISAQAYAYQHVSSVGTAAAVHGGSATTISHGPISCPSSALIIQAFYDGGVATGPSSLSGGTNRYNGLQLQTSDANASATFSATWTGGNTSGNWASLANVLSP